MRQRIALAGLPKQQRTARVRDDGAGVSRQHGNENQRGAVEIGRNADTARQWRAVFRVKHCKSAIASRSDQRLCQPDCIGVRRSDDILGLFQHTGLHQC
jgi:hypothetical protein